MKEHEKKKVQLTRFLIAKELRKGKYLNLYKGETI